MRWPHWSWLVWFLLVWASLFATGRGLPGQQLSSGSAEAQTRLHGGELAYAQGRWAEAEAAAREVLRAAPGSRSALVLLARTQFHEGKAQDSLQTFTRAAQGGTPSALDFRYVALDYVLLNDFADAERWIQRSLREDPGDGESWYALGRIQATDNRFNDAIVSFTKALERMPRSVKAENNLGLCYEGLNQPDEAIKAYRQALAWQAGDPHPSEQPGINLGILLTDRNQLEEALALLKEAERLNPNDNRVHGALGRLYTRRNELQLAQGELEKATAADPRNSGLHFQLGQVYRRQGMAERAAAELKEAARLEQQGRH